MNNRRWFVVVGDVVQKDDGGSVQRDTDFAIVIAYSQDDVVSWASKRFDAFDVFPAGEFIVDLTRTEGGKYV